MSGTSVERVAAALLYEGYMLYPYRRSAVKNRQRFNFGVIYPEPYSRAQAGTDLCEMRTECLVQGDADTALDVTVRFLHLCARAPERPTDPVWHDAVEREVTALDVRLGDLAAGIRAVPFAFTDAVAAGRQVELDGRVDVGAEMVAPGVFRLAVGIVNLTSMDAAGADARAETRDEAMLRALVSAHTILRVRGGEFVSLIEPPAALSAPAAACRNVGTWPVLAGEDGARDTMLSSPIIVADFPAIAPESPGDFFDGTEMDEMLTLRILTLTDEEKREMGASDERVRRLLERTEAFGEEQLMQMHGVLRQIRVLGEAP